MSRHYQRRAASFITAAAVLAVVFAAFFAVGDALPLPDKFLEILGLASADTTGVGELGDELGEGGGLTGLDSAEATDTAAPLTSLEGTGPATAGQSADTSATLDLESSEPTSGSASSNQDFSNGGAAGGKVYSPGASPAGTTVDDSASGSISSLGLSGASRGPSSLVLATDTTPPAFPAGALLVFRYPTTSGFTVGYTRATDDESLIVRYELLIEEIEGLGSDTVLSSTEASTGADSYVATGLTAGAYRVSVFAVDETGNESNPLIGEVLVGHAQPKVLAEFLDPKVRDAVMAGSWVTWGSTVQLAISVETPAPSYRIRTKGIGGITTTTSSIESSSTTSTVVTFAGEGVSLISITAIDCFSLESTPTTMTLKVDRNAPTAVSLLRATQLRGTTNLSVAWVGGIDLTSGVSHYEVTLTDTASGTVRMVRKGGLAGTTHTFTDLAPSSYRIDVVTVDVAGNKSVPVSMAYVVSAPVATTPRSSSGGMSATSGDSGVDEPVAAPQTETPPVAEPVDEPAPSGPSRPIDTKVNDSNRLYWLIGAVGFGLGLLLIYFTAVARAFSKKDSAL